MLSLSQSSFLPRKTAPKHSNAGTTWWRLMRYCTYVCRLYAVCFVYVWARYYSRTRKKLFIEILHPSLARARLLRSRSISISVFFGGFFTAKVVANVWVAKVIVGKVGFLASLVGTHSHCEDDDRLEASYSILERKREGGKKGRSITTFHRLLSLLLLLLLQSLLLLLRVGHFFPCVCVSVVAVLIANRSWHTFEYCVHNMSNLRGEF